MNDRTRRRFRAGMERLSAAERRRLEEMLARIETRAAEIERCLHCAASAPRPWGRTPSGLPRLRCRACRRTFSAAAGTALARIRRIDAFAAALADMRAAATPGSCRELAARLGVGRTTIWRWRMRVLAALAGIGAPRIAGHVEATAFLMRESRKASREWVNHERWPDRFPAPPRPRWREADADPGFDVRPWLLRALTLADQGGLRRADLLQGPGASLRWARRAGAPGASAPCEPGTRPLADLRAFLAPFCGPATRRAQGYLDWFLAREAHDRSRAETAWRRLLAA